MEHLGDITKIKSPPHVDVIFGGSPCQDLSQAGKRAGLKHEGRGDDETTRSGLFFEQTRIIKEMLHESGGVSPHFAIWENVAGAASSNSGADFRSVLEEFARCVEPGVCIPQPNGRWPKAGFICGNGWSLGWRLFNAEHWRIPQRRKRFAVVLDTRGQCAAEVLAECTGMPGYSEPDIEPWPFIARDPRDGSEVSDQLSYELLSQTSVGCFGNGIKLQPEVADTLKARDYKDPPIVFMRKYCLENHPADSRVKIKEDGICQTLTSRMGTGGGNVPMVLEAKMSWDGSQTCSTLTARNAGGAQRMPDKQNFNAVIEIGKDPDFIVRRLTEVEVERLQGFPDNWTDIKEWEDADGKVHKNSGAKRYEALGNSICLPQWYWLCRKMGPYLPERATMASLFDGIGGFPLVWETIYGKGTAIWASEIEPFPIAVTKKHFKETEHAD